MAEIIYYQTPDHFVLKFPEERRGKIVKDTNTYTADRKKDEETFRQDLYGMIQEAIREKKEIPLFDTKDNEQNRSLFGSRSSNLSSPTATRIGLEVIASYKPSSISKIFMQNEIPNIIEVVRQTENPELEIVEKIYYPKPDKEKIIKAYVFVARGIST